MWWLCWYWCWWQKAQHGSQKLVKELTQTPLFLLSIWCCFCQVFWRDNQRPIPGLRKLGKELGQTPLSPENQKLDTGRNAKRCSKSWNGFLGSPCILTKFPNWIEVATANAQSSLINDQPNSKTVLITLIHLSSVSMPREREIEN